MKQWSAFVLVAILSHAFTAPSHWKYGGDLDSAASGYVESSGSASGGLYAGASAGSDFKASAGLGGEVSGAKSAGSEYVLTKSSEFTPPQFLSYNDGKLGVNFGGYHASVGLGGAVGSGTSGGLFAEAGTPTGQHARAGLGGSVESSGKASGGLYAGATAGGNVKASAGLGGEVKSDSHVASKSSVEVAPQEVIRETVYVEPIHAHKKLHSEFKFNVGTAPIKTNVEEHVRVKTKVQPTIVKEVHYIQPAVVKEKHIVHTHVKPAVEKRVEYVSSADVGGHGEGYAHTNADTSLNYNSHIKFKSNPTFFADIFNIPIATLKAVGNFVGNTARNTGFSVENSASVKAGGSGYAYLR